MSDTLYLATSDLNQKTHSTGNQCTMAARIDVPAIPGFDADSDGSSIGTRWESGLERFHLYTAAAAIKDKTQKRALLLHMAGESVQKAFKGLKDTGDTDNFDAAVKALNDHFLPQKNYRFERSVFLEATQQTDETVDQYVARLRSLALTCDFTDTDDAIADHIIRTCRSTRLKRCVLRDSNATLETILKEGRALERVESQIQHMTHTEEATANAVTRNKQRNRGNWRHQGKSAKPLICFHCGGDYPHAGACPAEGKTCGKCGKQNHFASVCQSQRRSKTKGKYPRKKIVNTVGPIEQTAATNVNDGLSSSDNEWVLSVDTKHHVNALYGKWPSITVAVAGVNIPVLMDSGASVNLIDKHTYEALCRKQQIMLTPDKTKIYVYGATTPLPVAGKFNATISTADTGTSATFHVTRGNAGCLLGYSTATELGLINIPKLVNAVDVKSTPPDFIKEFEDIFKGIGKLKDYKFRIHINPNIAPVAQPPRRIPFHVRAQVEEQLHKLESAGIIEPVDGPTPWVSPLVIVPKGKGKVRVCVDMRLPNTAVQRERHPTPTLDEVIHDLTGATVFSKLDLHQAYHQVELNPESRYLTTFVTHKGLRRYTRLMYGLSSASEIFQEIIEQVLAGIQGVRNISDDIVVFGKDQTSMTKACA